MTTEMLVDIEEVGEEAATIEEGDIVSYKCILLFLFIIIFIYLFFDSLTIWDTEERRDTQ